MRNAVLGALLAFMALAAPCRADKPVIPRPAPGWTLKDVDGKAVSLSQFKGKVVILDFWATWCPPCRTEIPRYAALLRKYGAEGLVVVGISVDSIPPAEVGKFMKDMGIVYTVVMADDAVQDAYGPLNGYPTTFIIDRDGVIRKSKLGLKPEAAFEKDVLSVLRPPVS